MTDNDRLARCAWLRYLDTLLDLHWGDLVEEASVEATAALNALPVGSEERAAHLAWRHEVSGALEDTLQRFCPGRNPNCCDEQFWPKESE